MAAIEATGVTGKNYPRFFLFHRFPPFSTVLENFKSFRYYFTVFYVGPFIMRMKRQSRRTIRICFLCLIIPFVLLSCVTYEEYQETLKEIDNLKSESESIAEDNQNLKTKIDQISAILEAIQKTYSSDCIEIATEAYNRDDYQIAYREFAKSVILGCTDGIVWYRYAYSLEQLEGLTEDALSLYEKAYEFLQEQYQDHKYLEYTQYKLKQLSVRSEEKPSQNQTTGRPPQNRAGDTGERMSEQKASIEDAAPVEKVTLPDCRIVDEDVYDAPVKTQVVQHIVVSGKITEENLRALLVQQHHSISRRTGFKYHDSPTNIYIYVYETDKKAEAGQGLWLAMSQMSYGDAEPQINVRTEQIARIGQELPKKFGLREEQRREVFREIARLEKKATDEAIQRFPSDINKQIDLETKLDEKYKDELAAKYQLTRDQLQSIMVEGVKNLWLR